MDQRNRAPFDTIVRLLTGVLLMTSAVCIALGQNPVPLINQPLVPEAAKPGGAAFTLTVNGTGFVAGSVVHWNGAARTTTFVSQAQLKASILATDIATARTATVTVVNPATGGGTSNVVFFQVTTPNSDFGFALTGYATSDRSYGVAVGDFNGDGKPDLAVADFNTSAVSVFIGNGNGTFQPRVDYPVGSEPQSVAVGDFNHDGRLDLAVVNFFSNNVSILLGNGDGTFKPHVDYVLGNFPAGVAVADFNHDGKLDLAITNYADNDVSVLIGNGDGTFKPAVNYAVGSHPGFPAVGDFNRDGKLDLVVANNASNTVSILTGNGDGTFKPAVSYATAPSPTSIAAADFNADGRLDLAVGGGTGVSVLIGNGDGTFQTHIDYGTGSSNPCSVAVGDFNGDGIPDLVVADLFSTDVRLLPGNANGTFGTATSFAAGPEPSSVALGDFNGDGNLDVAVADANSPTVSVLLLTTVVLSSPSLTFANQVIHTSSTSQSVTLTNDGGSALTIDSITITGADPSDFSQTDTCGSSVPALGGNCTITVTFTPAATGSRTASITITDSAGTSPQVVQLAGTGVAPEPVATLSPATLTFSTQVVGTSSAAQTVTLTNTGTLALSLSSIGLTGADPGDFLQTNTCPTSIAIGASCTISVTFKPTATNTRTASLSVTDNAPGSPQTVSLIGGATGVGLNPTSLAFGTAVCCASHSAATTLTNAGSTTLSISGITISGTAFSQTNTCGSSLGAGKSCTITVTFSPPTKGTYSGTLSVSDNNASSPQKASLSGGACVVGSNHKCAVAPVAASPAVRSALAARTTVAVPRFTGPASVGTTVMDLADSDRDDPFLADGTKRELLVRFWYPASLTQNCKPAEYTSSRVWDYFARLAHLPLPLVTTNSCLDATVAEGQHPVVVFTPGYTGTFTDYTFLFEDLASRGYVVASIDHTHEATAVEFPDGRFSTSEVGSHLDNSWRTDDETVSRALSARLDDLTFAMNELQRMNGAAGNPLAGKLDLTRVAVAGHSVGGLTTWLGVQRDQRFKAAVLLDPYLANIGSDPTETPVLLMAMGRDKPTQSECRLWSDLQGPRSWVNVPGAEHVTPSDAVWLARGAVKTGPIGTDKTIDELRSHIAAFLETNLRGPTFQPPKAPPLGFPEAAVTAQKQPMCEQP